MTNFSSRQRNEVELLQYAQGIYRLLATLHVGDRETQEC